MSSYLLTADCGSLGPNIRHGLGAIHLANSSSNPLRFQQQSVSATTIFISISKKPFIFITNSTDLHVSHLLLTVTNAFWRRPYMQHMVTRRSTHAVPNLQFMEAKITPLSQRRVAHLRHPPTLLFFFCSRNLDIGSRPLSIGKRHERRQLGFRKPQARSGLAMRASSGP